MPRHKAHICQRHLREHFTLPHRGRSDHGGVNYTKFPKKKNGINVLNLPVVSLDPIVHLLDELVTCVHRLQLQCRNQEGLKRCVVEEWYNIPQRTIQSVCKSMTCRAFLNANGEHMYTRINGHN